MGALSDMSFCSKMFYTQGGNLYATRDYHKTLSTKMYYSKKNEAIFHNPDLHASALYLALKSEKSSHLLEDIMQARIRNF
jgi:hypothetical protein